MRRSTTFLVGCLLLMSAAATAQIPDPEKTRCVPPGLDPHYLPVRDAGPAQEPPPEIMEGTVREAFANFYDYPYDHFSHDVNFYLEPDPDYREKVGLANAVEIIDGRLVQLMEMEWDMSLFPSDVWPIVGDRVWMKGRYIWDCGHRPYKNEIHPPQFVAFTRFSPDVFPSDRAVGDTSHYSLMNKTYMFANGAPGYRYGPRAIVGGQFFEFDLPLPPRPSTGATPVAEVASITSATDAPQLSIVTDAAGRSKVHIRWKPLPPSAAPDDSSYAVIASGWREEIPTTPFLAIKPRTINLKINNAHRSLGDVLSPFGTPNPWNMWIQVGTRWAQVVNVTPEDGREYAIRQEFDPIAVPVRRVRNPEVNAKPLGRDQLPENEPFAVSTCGWKSKMIDREFGKTMTSGIIDLFRAKRRRGETDVLDALADLSGQNALIGQVNRVYYPDAASDEYRFEFPPTVVRETSRVPSTYPFLSEETGEASPDTNRDFELTYDFMSIEGTPEIRDVSPIAAGIGDLLFVSGRHLDSTPAQTIVSFKSATGRIEVPASFASYSSLSVNVPAGAVDGPIAVRTLKGQTLVAAPLRIFPAPLIADFNPRSGGIGTIVTIQGSNFGVFADDRYLDQKIGTGASFGGGGSDVVSATDTELKVRLRRGVASGNVRVTVGRQVATMAGFTLQPAAPPPELPRGAAVRINSNAAGYGSQREMTLEKTMDFINGTLGRPLATRPRDANGAITDNTPAPYEEELATGDEIKNGAIPTGVFRDLGAAFSHVLEFALPGTANTVTVTKQIILGNGVVLKLGGARLVGSGVEGILLAGPRSSLWGPGSIESFRTAGVIIRGAWTTIQARRSSASPRGLDVIRNEGAGIWVDNANHAWVSSDSALERLTIADNRGAGLVISGAQAVDGLHYAATLGADQAAGFGGNERGLEISGGASNNFVRVIAVRNNRAEGVLVSGGHANSLDVRATNNGTDGIVVTDGRINQVNGESNDNPRNGVRLSGRNTYGNTIATFSALRNGSSGVRVESGARANALRGVKARQNSEAGITITGAGTDGQIVANGEFGGQVASETTNAQKSGVVISSSASYNTLLENTVAGNVEAGVKITGAGTSRNSVTASYIGPRQAPPAGFQQKHGIVLGDGAAENLIGLELPVGGRPLSWAALTTAMNYVVGNSEAGIRVEGGATSANFIGANLIGVLDSTTPIPNRYGIDIDGATRNFVGGAEPFRARNTVDGNREAGILIRGTNDQPATENVIVNNMIGARYGNAVGVKFQGVSARNRVGGLLFNEGNIITHNGTAGLLMTGATPPNFDASASPGYDQSNVVIGNVIGLDLLASADTQGGNEVGVRLEDGTANQVIGGTQSGAFNMISGNLKTGVEIAGAQTVNNRIVGNRIGTDRGGTRALLNLTGIDIQRARSTGIEGNLIASNGTNQGGTGIRGVGVHVQNVSGGGATTISRNLIGTDVTGTQRMANDTDGIRVVDSADVQIGGPLADEGNLIAGNGRNGIRLTGSGTARTRIWSNRINVEIGGALLENRGNGILIENGAASTTVGGRAFRATQSIRAANLIGVGDNDAVKIADDAGPVYQVRENEFASVFPDRLPRAISPRSADTQVPPQLALGAATGMLVASVDPTRVPDSSVVDFFGSERGDVTLIGSAIVTGGRAIGDFDLPLGSVTATATTPAGATSRFSAAFAMPPDIPPALLTVNEWSAVPPSAVHANDTRVPIIGLGFRTTSSLATLRQMIFQVGGSAPANALTNIRVWEDRDVDGKVGTADRQITATAAINATARTVTVTLSETIAAAVRTRWIVTADLTAAAQAGQSAQVRVERSDDISVVATPQGPRVAVGLPLAGPLLRFP
jgi:hypothetical protein